MGASDDGEEILNATAITPPRKKTGTGGASKATVFSSKDLPSVLICSIIEVDET